MNIIFLLGPSSVGKSTLCEELKKYKFHIVKNGDQYFQEYLDSIVERLRQENALANLEPIRSDELLYFCVNNKLSIAKSPNRIINHPVNDLSQLEAVLKGAGFEETKIFELAQTLRLAKKLYEADKESRPTYYGCLEKSLSEALDLSKRDQTIVLDLVPEGTPEETQKLLDAFTKRANAFGKENQIDMKIIRVLQYCSPEQMSRNMMIRNIKAENSANSIDKREGISPFQALSCIAIAGEENEMENKRYLFSLSKTQLFEIIQRHCSSSEVASSFEELVGQGVAPYFPGFQFPKEKDEAHIFLPLPLVFDHMVNSEGNLATIARNLVKDMQLFFNKPDDSLAAKALVNNPSGTLFVKPNTDGPTEFSPLNIVQSEFN